MGLDREGKRKGEGGNGRRTICRSSWKGGKTIWAASRLTPLPPCRPNSVGHAENVVSPSLRFTAAHGDSDVGQGQIDRHPGQSVYVVAHYPAPFS